MTQPRGIAPTRTADMKLQTRLQIRGVSIKDKNKYSEFCLLSKGPPYKTFGVIEVFCGEYDSRGLKFLKESKFQEALDYCEEGLKRCPDSAYYVRQKGLAMLGLGKEKEALECFNSGLEKFHRYSVIYPLTAIDLFEITFRTMWQLTSILKLSERQKEFKLVFDQFFDSLTRLEEYTISRNTDYGKSLISPEVAQYGAYACAILGDNEGAITYVKSIVDYWIGYINYYGEPCNADKVEIANELQETFNRERAFEDLKSNDKVMQAWDNLRNHKMKKK